MPETPVGKVTHYFGKIGVAAIEMQEELQVGDRVRFAGHSTDFEQDIDSMQLEHEAVQKAEPGQSIGIKVIERVREGDIVYKIS